MNKQYKQLTKDSDKGFTIIEVVLVLAIAGLIFLMVFIALPSLQRGQRDAQRKEDLSRVSVQLTNYLSSTRGAVPDTDDKMNNFVRGYLKGANEEGTQRGLVTGEDYTDPNGDKYKVRFEPPTLNANEIGYWSKRGCGDNIDTSTSPTNTGARGYALTVKLENQTAPYCIDNKS